MFMELLFGERSDAEAARTLHKQGHFFRTASNIAAGDVDGHESDVRTFAFAHHGCRIFGNNKIFDAFL